jgi:uncharacterized protein involved in response to NO
VATIQAPRQPVNERKKRKSMRVPLPIHGVPGSNNADTAIPPYLAKGFRPFFLFGAVTATLIVPLWLLVLWGKFVPSPYFAASAWHAHEMTFGFACAIVAGFLLTAVANWTGRETLTGYPLLGLTVLFGFGRVAILLAGSLPRILPLVVDGAFLPVLVFVLARPIFATKNYRNLVVLAVVVGLALANLSTHAGALGLAPQWERRGCLVGIDLIVMMCALIAGRVVPMFTRNRTKVESIRGSVPLDIAALVLIVVVIVLDALGVAHVGAAFPSLAVASVLVLRTRTWGTRHALSEPLLWILHVGHGWLALGFLLKGLSYLGPSVPPFAAIHAFTVGGIGSLTLGMMTRVALGHTGRMLVAPRVAVLAFGLVNAATVFRVFVPLLDAAWTRPALMTAGIFFAVSFLAYLVSFASILFAPRVDAKPG